MTKRRTLTLVALLVLGGILWKPSNVEAAYKPEEVLAPLAETNIKLVGPKAVFLHPGDAYSDEGVCVDDGKGEKLADTVVYVSEHWSIREVNLIEDVTPETELVASEVKGYTITSDVPDVCTLVYRIDTTYVERTVYFADEIYTPNKPITVTGDTNSNSNSNNSNDNNSNDNNSNDNNNNDDNSNDDNNNDDPTPPTPPTPTPPTPPEPTPPTPPEPTPPTPTPPEPTPPTPPEPTPPTPTPPMPDDGNQDNPGGSEEAGGSTEIVMPDDGNQDNPGGSEEAGSSTEASTESFSLPSDNSQESPSDSVEAG